MQMIDVKQKRKLAVAVIALCVLFLVSTALAYLVDRKTVTNIFGLGNTPGGGSPDTVWIEVAEDGFLSQNIPDTKIKTIHVTTNHIRHELTGLKPGNKINKDTTIVVKGISSYIRVKPIMDLTDKDGKILQTANPSTVLTKQNIVNQLAIYGGELNDVDKWVFHDDGYMYYTEAVSKIDDLTGTNIPLLKDKSGHTLEIPKTWGSDVKPLTIQFTADAIQSEGVLLETDSEKYPSKSLWRDADDNAKEASDDIFTR